MAALIQTYCLTFVQWVRGGPQPRTNTSHLISLILAATHSVSQDETLAQRPTQLSSGLAYPKNTVDHVLVSFTEQHDYTDNKKSW